MPVMPDLGEGGNIAAAATGGGVGIVMLLQVWKQIRQSFSAATNEKQQEAFQTRTLARIQELEKKLEDMQSKNTEQSIALGTATGERNAAKSNYEEMTKNKDYWRERALAVEIKNAELDKAVDMLSVHLMQLQIKLGIKRGDIDPKSSPCTPLIGLPESVQARMAEIVRITE